jgi:hypothetical protein
VAPRASSLSASQPPSRNIAPCLSHARSVVLAWCCGPGGNGSRCAGPVTSASRAWLHRSSSLALPQAAEPGRESVQAPASPVPVASVRLGCRLSHTSVHVSPASRLRLRSGLTRRSSGQPPAGGVGALRGVRLRRCLPLNSNVGRHGSSCLSSKRRCISHCSRFASMPTRARAVRPLAAGEPQQRFSQVHAGARLGCPSFGGQRAARSVQATRSLANARLFAQASQGHACASARRRSPSSRRQRTAHSAQADHLLAIARLFSEESRSQSVTNARCRSEGSRSTLRVMQAAASCSSNQRAQPLLGAAVSLFFACRPTPPSSGQPSAAAHVER